MRQATTSAQALAWHTQALNDLALHLDLVIDYHTPQCGWFETKRHRGGIMVPARIWLEQEVDENGALLSDEVFKAEIDGREADPLEVWEWCAARPITPEQFNYMTARGKFARKWSPQEPAANPHKAVDWLKTPIPTFSKEEATP